jgi:autotransporter-associated beta strand protein
LGFNVGGQVQVGSGSHVSSSLTGNVGISPHDLLTFTVGPYATSYPYDSRPELDVSAVVLVNGIEFGRLPPAGIIKAGAGRMRLGANNTYKGTTYVNAGKLQADGVQPQSLMAVASGAQLQGVGAVGEVSLTGSSATLAPGNGPGMLTCSNLDNTGGTGILQVELNGPTAGSGYDQLNVNGSVTLSGIALNASLNYTSAVNDQFTIIANDGSDPISGTFNGLPQNAKLYIGGQVFRISYTGGSGNDVVLTRLVTPPPPTLTIQDVSPAFVRLVWPTNDPPFSLQVCTNLVAANWTNATPLPVVLGTNDVVTNAISGKQAHYRLSNP